MRVGEAPPRPLQPSCHRSSRLPALRPSRLMLPLLGARNLVSDALRVADARNRFGSRRKGAGRGDDWPGKRAPPRLVAPAGCGRGVARSGARAAGRVAIEAMRSV